ncbi:2-hydroxymuconate tautomerase [Nonomuraea sp. NPDC049480]|uniref:2-hydroxymuconate tautomerase n=1 Tax=Nonomuraea sp. NPDC049480 TaxID=3364353 RepID=UPI0037B7CDC9
MPLIQVTMQEGRSPEQKRALLAAITTAVHDSIGVPVEAVRVWVVEVSPEAFMAGGVLAAERQKPRP